jgi:MSHA biogenesis protein MshI
VVRLDKEPETEMFKRAQKAEGAAGWTAVDFGGAETVGVSVRPPPGGDGKPQVVKCGIAPQEELNGALAALARKISVTGFPWTVPLRRGDYKIMVVPRPPVQDHEIAESVRWSLGSMIDFAVEEATVDWMSIPTHDHMPEKPQQLYAIVARRKTVDERVAPFQRAKVPLSAVDIRETSQRNIAALVEKDGEGLGMISITDVGVQITFTWHGELYLDRFIDETFESILNGDDETRMRIFDRITLQVQRSIDYMQRTLPFIPIRRIVMAPMPAPIAVADHLTTQIAEPVETLDLASVMDFSATPELLEEENQARYFMALGSALRFQGKASA